MSEASNNWIEIFTALLTPTIAILGIWIAFQQWSINKANLRERLFERRMAVFKETQSYLSEIMRNAKISDESISKFNDTHQRARFLLGKEIQDYLVEVRNHSIDMSTYRKMMIDIPPSEERTGLVDKEQVELKWLLEQLNIIFDKFEPFLGFEKHR